MTEPESSPPPKRSETDPPAANRPTAESKGGDPPPKPVEPADAAGRTANDPSVKEHGLVHEALQCAPGKPDGEVDTGNRRDHPASLFS